MGHLNRLLRLTYSNERMSYMFMKTGYLRGIITGGAFGVLVGMLLSEKSSGINFSSNFANSGDEKCYNELSQSKKQP